MIRLFGKYHYCDKNCTDVLNEQYYTKYEFP